MSFAMFLVLPMVYFVTRLFAKKVYLADGLTIEEYKVRKETVNLFLAKILVIGFGLIALCVIISVVINVAIFLAPYVLGFFLVSFLFSMISGIGEGLLITRFPFLFL